MRDGVALNRPVVTPVSARWILGGLVLALILAVGPIHAASRSALGLAVNGCVLSKQMFGATFPCLAVDLSQGVERGHAIVRPPISSTEILVVPTAHISGIESPALQRADAPGFFQAGWSERPLVVDALGRDPGWDAIGMAVNSRPDRSQDRLHIHVDCLRPSVQEALQRDQHLIGNRWSPLPFRLAGALYWGRRISSADFAGLNPFESMRTGVPAARQSMADMTLAVIGATFEDGTKGFYLLANSAKSADRNAGTSEYLLDHTCRIANS